MKEKIQRFSKGNFEYDNPSICLSVNELNISAEAGKLTKGSFIISNSSNKRMKGSIQSSVSHMKLENSVFNDTENEIKYIFDAALLTAGEIIRGYFNIISDCGECELPFTVAIEAAYIQTPSGRIMNLEQFTALARMDWVEAKRIFRSEEFERVLLDAEQRDIYKHLVKSVSTSQALEEFLISIDKKTAILLEIDKTSVKYRIGTEDIVDRLVLTKSSWGYAEIRVTCDASFIQLDQKYLWADRFIGNTHQIMFTIDAKQLKKGNNYGHIYIKTPLQTLTVNILCNNSGDKAAVNRPVKKAKVKMITNYLNFRENRLDIKDYVDKTQALLKYIQSTETTYIGDLLKLYLAVLTAKAEQAQALIDQLSEEAEFVKQKSVLEYCIYLYLKALYMKTEEAIAAAAGTIRSLYQKGYDDWRMLWLLIYTDKRYTTNKKMMLADIREQFAKGCRSPIMYYEAICCFNEEPSSLRELNPFEIQVINYGTRNGLLTLDVIRQFTYLANKRKTFNPVIFYSLQRLYKSYNLEEILTAICCMLIKGPKRDEKYFEWFRLGVLSQAKITGLYEYYMYSMSNDYQGTIAPAVMLYFIYNSNLNDKKTALLYAYIIKHKEKEEHIYRSYYRRMEVFAVKMLEKHQINDNLAILYDEFFRKGRTDKILSDHIPYVLFQNEITCSNSNMVSVTILHKELEQEETVQLVEGKAHVDIYSKSYEIIFTDTFGNRYRNSVKYKLKPYLNPDEYVKYCIDNCNDARLLLYMYDRYHNEQILNENAAMLVNKVLELDGLTKSFQTECLKLLSKYYSDNKDDRLISYISKMDIGFLSASERNKYMELLISYGYYDIVLEAIEKYGYEGLELTMLIKLCVGWLQAKGLDDKSYIVTTLCYYIFAQNKYDELILKYLVKNYRGSTAAMLSLLKAAKSFEVDTYKLSERLLGQMLFCESHLQDSFTVFCEYYDDANNHLLVKAFLTYNAYKYLVHDDNDIADSIFPIMRRELIYEENDVCLLAWLKKNACVKELSENDLQFAEYNIERLTRKGIVLPFFLEYGDRLSLPDSLIGKYYITYVSKPGSQVLIHYCIHNLGDEYVTERMPDIFMGIHMKELVLFYNDEVTYYISEESSEGVKKTEMQNIRYVCRVTDDMTKYNQINKMLMALEKRDDTGLLEMMKAYVKGEYMISACLRQI